MTVYSFYHESCISIVIRALLEINENCSVRLDTSLWKLWLTWNWLKNLM